MYLIWAFDQSTVILIQQVHVFNLGIPPIGFNVHHIVHVFRFDRSNVQTLSL